VKKGKLTRVDGRGSLSFSFNPTTVEVQKAANWSSTPGTQHPLAPPPEFVGTTACRLSMQVLFDAWSQPLPTVQSQVDELLSWTCPTRETLRAQQPQPPLVTLDWGGAPPARAWLVAQVTATFLLFDADGKPVRATVNLVLNETPTVARAQNPTSGGVPGTRQRTFVGGDSLASVAAEEYGDAGQWRALAAANGIDDPLRVPSGRSLIVPPRGSSPSPAAAGTRHG
jgi:nucleoid-associated protein YgaU